MICNFDKWPQNYLIKYTPLFQACCLVFSRNMHKDLLDHPGEMSVVLIFDICNVYETVAYDWLYSQYSGGSMALKFLGNFEDQHLFQPIRVDLAMSNGKTK